jgi:peptidoglycan/LPS O-acetylase OafA/YrhL
LILPHLVSVAQPGVSDIFHHQAWLWTYTANIAFKGKHKIYFDADWLRLSHFWSLAIEEQFYLAWPLVVFLLSPARLKKMSWWLVGGALALRVVVCLLHLPRGTMLYATPCRVDSLAMGALVALAFRTVGGVSRLRPLARRGIVIFGVLVIVAFVWPEERPLDDRTLVLTVGFTLLAAFFTCILLIAVDEKSPGSFFRRALENQSLRTLGKYSYGMYVVHMFVIVAVSAWLPLAKLAAWAHSEPAGIMLFCAVYVLATLAVSIALWHLYEKHFLKLKRYFAREPSGFGQLAPDPFGCVDGGRNAVKPFPLGELRLPAGAVRR